MSSIHAPYHNMPPAWDETDLMVIGMALAILVVIFCFGRR